MPYFKTFIGKRSALRRTCIGRSFFATALGFVIAAINYSVGQLPGLDSLTKAYPPAAGGVLNHHVLAHTWPVLLATVVTQNRKLTLRRYDYRARAVSCLLLSLLFALLETISVLVMAKTGLLLKV